MAAVFLFAAGLASGVEAHHSIGLFDLASPVWIKAVVVRYEPRNPHVMIELRQDAADGKSAIWKIEGPILSRLERMRLAPEFIKPGDVLEVCGFPYRNGIAGEGHGAPADASRQLHGMVLVLPDGARQPWGPYGKLDNCIRPPDTASMWVSFLDAQPMAQEYWCKGLRNPESARSNKALVDEIGQRMHAPCGT